MFDDIAPQLIEMLDGRMMVAHDASFDHRFLKLVAMRAGIDMPTKQRLCVAQPVIDNAFVQRTFDVSDMSAQRAIDRLVDAGVLHQISKGRRNRVWQADEILDALDWFAERSKQVLRPKGSNGTNWRSSASNLLIDVIEGVWCVNGWRRWSLWQLCSPGAATGSRGVRSRLSGGIRAASRRMPSRRRDLTRPTGWKDGAREYRSRSGQAVCFTRQVGSITPMV